MANAIQKRVWLQRLAIEGRPGRGTWLAKSPWHNILREGVAMAEGPCILIISAEYAAIRNELKEAGYATAGLPDAESARSIFDSMRPDLVIADVELAIPEGGRTLAYYVRVLSKRPRTPLVGLAGRPDSQEGRPPAERFDRICSRPLRGADLLQVVEELLKRGTPNSAPS